MILKQFLMIMLCVMPVVIGIVSYSIYLILIRRRTGKLVRFDDSSFIPDRLDNSATQNSADATDDSGEDTSASPLLHGSNKGRKTILVVDDDDDIRDFLCEELSGTYNVIQSNDGKNAFHILVRENVDLVVSDIIMPDVDGIELLKKIRNNPSISHIPVILLTAKLADCDRIEGFQMSADAYVTKPFNLELLVTMIGSLLRRNESLRNSFSGASMPVEQIDTPVMSSHDDKLMEQLIKCINDNLCNPEFTSEMLAKEIGISRVHLYRKLKELTNQSASNYIRNIRLTKAAELLHNHKGTVSEVAFGVGFKSLSHFTVAFKELYGMTPKEYMKAGK